MKQILKFFSEKVYDGLFLVLLFFLANRRALVCWYVVDPGYYCEYGNALSDYLMWGMVVLVALLLIVQRGKLGEYWLAWKANWLFGLFLLYSIASISWSVLVASSIHLAYVMLAISITGALLAVLYSPRQLLKILTSFTMVVGVASLLLVILFPEMGIYQEDYLATTWHGVFTHKNYLGSVMALGSGLSLISFVLATEKKDKYINFVFYLLALFLIIMSQSATGLILYGMVNGMSLLYFTWTRWYSKLQGRRNIYISGLVASVVILGISLVVVFGVMGKSINLTGRVPLWLNLLENVVSQKPWFGYGLETLWYSRLFQVWAGKTSGWGIIAVNGHSGYMDMLIYLGVVGLTILCAALAQGFVRTLKRALSGRTWLDFFPLLVLVYILVTNITISYFLEFETFHWLVLVTLLFLPSVILSEKKPA